MSRWKAQLGRVTLFPTIPAGAELGSAAEMYMRMWAAEPDSFQKQPQVGGAFAASFAQGTRDGLSLSCSVHPIRIDFAIMPLGSPGTTLGLIDDTKKFHETFARIVRSAPGMMTAPINRAACFAQFAVVAKDYSDANVLLSSSLPKKYALKLSDEEDFILQVNHIKPVADLRMNLITKWAAERLQVLSLQVGPSGAQAAAMSQLVSEHIVATVTFDNSNIATVPLSKDQLSAILDETLREISEEQREANLELEGF